ncbi:MAG: zinc-ribbon domain-containing protein [Pseudomonadota bacterium]
MELICPSCEARYQVPERAIGEKGRQVSCLNCGHGWHAYPPLVLKSPASTQKTGTRWQSTEPAHPGSGSGGADWLGRSTAAASAAGAVGATPGGPPPMTASDPPPVSPSTAEGLESFSPPPPSSSRTDQLAEIREMLAEVQSEDRAAAALKPAPDDLMSAAETGASPASEPKSPLSRMAAESEGRTSAAAEPQSMLDQDAATAEKAIREKLNIADVRAMAPKPPDPKRLRRAHDRKETKRRRRESAGSGAFLTCFLLVVMIAAVMISLYLLHQPIIEKVPSLGAPLTEYVATVDEWRVGIAETFDGLAGWVTDRLGENA